MNTYNDNLRASVVDSLGQQELEQKSMESKLNASKFTLYYAQGGKITDAEKLAAAEKEAKQKSKVKKQAVENSNISTNVLMSAEQQKSFTDLSITNASVAAANVQIAANAVLKLSSDMGSISSIINAADYGTDIYDLSEKTKGYMDKTAAHAELTSQFSMEASSLTSEVSSDAVEKQANVVNESIQNLLKVASAEYETASDLVTTDNAALAEASVKEKAAEGSLEDATVNYHAAKSASGLMSSELNLGLKTSNILFPVDAPDSELSFQVSFDALVSAFPKTKTTKGNTVLDFSYPVQDYYVFVVKSKKKSTFNISTAENIVNADTPDTVQYKRFVHQESEDQASYEVNVDASEYSYVYDSDGDKIEFGTNYVVFVFAKYYETYKSDLNVFENFLSAGSDMFTLKKKLIGPDAVDIKVIKEIEDLKFVIESDLIEIDVNEKVDKFAIRTKETVSQEHELLSLTLQFDLDDQANKGHDVEYRCMFVPANSELTEHLLTKTELKSIEKTDEEVQAVFESFSSDILTLQSEIEQLEVKIHNYKEGDPIDLDDLKQQHQTKISALKAAEKELANEIAKIKQTRLDSSFHEFEGLVQDLGTTTDLSKHQSKANETIDQYLKYDIDSDNLQTFKTNFSSVVTDLEGIRKTLDESNAEIAKKNKEIADNNKQISERNEEIEKLEAFIKDPDVDITDEEKADTQELIKEMKAEIKKLKNSNKTLNTNLTNLQTQVTAEEKEWNDYLKDQSSLDEAQQNSYTKLMGLAKKIDKAFNDEVGSLSFYFDLDIAEQVSSANYWPALLKTDSLTQQAGTNTWYRSIAPNTTDNFGNPLVPGEEYIPVILSFFNSPEVDMVKFKNTLSDVDSTAKFTYAEVSPKESNTGSAAAQTS